jgi:hypothetical protein
VCESHRSGCISKVRDLLKVRFRLKKLTLLAK